MNLAWFDYEMLGDYLDEYHLLIEKFTKDNKSIYDKLFSDEIYGYRKGNIELQADLLYINYYFYSIFKEISLVKNCTTVTTACTKATREQKIQILENMQWECIVKTLFCKGIKIGKYYNTILNLS